MMSVLEQLSGLLQSYGDGFTPATRQEARQHYDQISSSVPADLLASVIGPAIGSLGAHQIQERIYNSATEMDNQQRGNFLRMLIEGFRGSGSHVKPIFGEIGVDPRLADEPETATPEDVAKIASHAQQTRPDIFNRAMQFYAQNPQLVKVLGGLAIAAIARNLAQKR